MPAIRFRACAIACSTLCAAMAPLAGSAVAAPLVQSITSRWTFDFKPGELRLYVDDESGKAYWFITYTVVNRTGEDRMWAPRFEMLTDDGKISRSGRDVPSSVSRDVLRLLGSELIEDQNQIIGELLQGVENAKDGVVIWPANNLAVKEMTLFVSGLSGESKTVKHPVTDADVVLGKTLCREYLSPGEAILRKTEPVGLREQTWVWR